MERRERLPVVGVLHGIHAEHLAVRPRRDGERDVVQRHAGLVGEEDVDLRLPDGIEDVFADVGLVHADRLIGVIGGDHGGGDAVRVPAQQEVAVLVRERRRVVGERDGEVVLPPGEPHALVEARDVAGDAVGVSAHAVERRIDREALGKSGAVVGVQHQVHHRRDVPGRAGAPAREDGAHVDDVIAVGVGGVDDVHVARRADVGERQVVLAGIDHLPALPHVIVAVVVRGILAERGHALRDVAARAVLGIEPDLRLMLAGGVDRLVLEDVEAGALPERADRERTVVARAERERRGLERAVLLHLVPAHEAVGTLLVRVAVEGVGGLVHVCRVVGAAGDVRDELRRIGGRHVLVAQLVVRMVAVVVRAGHVQAEVARGDILVHELVVVDVEPCGVVAVQLAAVRVDDHLVLDRFPLGVDRLGGAAHLAAREIERHGAGGVLVPAAEGVVFRVATVPVDARVGGREVQPGKRRLEHHVGGEHVLARVGVAEDERVRVAGEAD